MPVTVRVAVADDAQHLSAIEASAALAFRRIDELSWVAQSLPMSVALPWLGQGLGRRLIEVAQDHARSNGLRLITLTTFIDVPWNAPFYARMGFQAKATRDLEPRLAALLSAEYQRGYAPGSRCAMVWSVT
ncbi:GNAT family N-acetyltransferase [Pseudomonas fluorescens]|uniref:GNAT family N-acetyltransferase n=1 Tax=Pseudomonas fluorescens TaxID=294 RepID=UPI0010D49C46|nr:GNAT family N-acetyltransferase [Pseudomonas fluorescens]TCV68225.1 acetyltransferase (GNAT) family protein [Pseudomonas fluorescens]